MICRMIVNDFHYQGCSQGRLGFVANLVLLFSIRYLCPLKIAVLKTRAWTHKLFRPLQLFSSSYFLDKESISYPTRNPNGFTQ